MRQIEFYHGTLSDSYEKQANAQGYTLGDKAELFDEIASSYNLLKMHGYLTESQADKICQKIQKNLVKSVKKLKG